MKQAAEVESRGAEFLSCFGAVLNPLGLRSKTAMDRNRAKLMARVSVALFAVVAVALVGLTLKLKYDIGKLDKEKEQLPFQQKTFLGSGRTEKLLAGIIQSSFGDICGNSSVLL